MPLRDYQQVAIRSAFDEWRENTATLIVAATGTGKCLGVGTPVLKLDGTIVPVQSLKVGDSLVGPDSLPRVITSVCQGTGQLYKVTPTKGDPYVVNSDHILCLRFTNNGKKRDGTIIDVSVQDYLASNKDFKHCAKGWRSPVIFPHHFVPLDPYFLGLWLGDGSRQGPIVYKPDSEVRATMQAVADSFGLSLRVFDEHKCPGYAIAGSKGVPNPVWQIIKSLGLGHEKFVPHCYKANSFTVQSEILAGLLDSDGCLSQSGYDFISSDKALSNDVAFLARSLGLAAYVSECRKGCQKSFVGVYWRVSISGDCSFLPLRLPRKKAPKRLQKKNVLNHGITVEPIGDGQYFGFTLTGDGRFLLGDFTVTHNTTIFSDIVRRFLPQRSCVVAHREELIFQANDRLKSFGVTTDIEMGDLTATTDLFGRAQCVVATVQTLHKRLARFNPQDFGLLVIDEVHHVTAKTYLDIVNHFKKNTDLRILGVTATPDRADEEALGQIIDTVAFEYDILTAINDGWLVPVDQQVVRVSGLDFSQCRTTAGDLNGADLAMVMEAEKNLQGICGSSIEIIGDRQTILFAATVVQAEKACEIFNRHRAGMATFICGATDQETRRERVAQFRDGKVQVLTNVGVMTEGADFPAVSVALLARPTESRSLYAQMSGRCMRVLPGVVDHLATADERQAAIAASGKPSCLLVDFVGNSGRHKLMTSADILGGKVTDAAVERAKKIVENKGGQCRMVEVLAEAEKELREENEQRRRDEEARRAKLIAQVKYTTKKVSPFDVFGLSPARERGWDRGKTLSDKQRGLLLKQGIDGDAMPYAQAKQILNEIFRRWDKGQCSYKQAALLKKHGYDGKASREEASKIIDALAKNGWRRPEVKA